MAMWKNIMELPVAQRSSRGFTLVELMIVVVVASILLAVAIPSYKVYVRNSRRTEAKTAVLDLAGREERYFSTNGANYSAVAANMGYTAFGVPIGSGYYQLAVSVPATTPNAPATPSYSITATPVAGQSQVNDAQCTSFSVDSSGAQFSTGTATAQYCWGN
jgi:type IV pilus assembly protein PilE